MTAAVSGGRLGERSIPPDWIQRTEGADRIRDLADRFFIRRHIR